MNKYHVEFDVDFRRNPYKGLYIVIEGIDGSGKTTQAKKLCNYFEKSKIPAVCTGEPRKGVGVVGKLIQEILNSKAKVPPIAFQYLFSADRAIHHEELIIPSLKSGKYVVSDRSFWSAIPYGIMDQMMGEKKGKYNYEMGEIILTAQSILSMYHQFMVPDITIYLKISIDTAMQRLGKKHEGSEIYEKREILENITEGYDWLVKKFPEEFIVVDGEKPVDIITQEILEIIKDQKK